MAEVDARSVPDPVRRTQNGGGVWLSTRSIPGVVTQVSTAARPARRVAGLIMNFVRRSQINESRRGWNLSKLPKAPKTDTRDRRGTSA